MSLDIVTVISYDRNYFNLNHEITKRLNDYPHNWIVVENYSKEKHGAFDPDKKKIKLEDVNIKYLKGIDQDLSNPRIIEKKYLLLNSLKFKNLNKDLIKKISIIKK